MNGYRPDQARPNAVAEPEPDPNTHPRPVIVLLAAAVIAAITGAIYRNPTSYALLASFVLSEALCLGGAEFNGALWMAIDALVIGIVVRTGMKRTDWLIVGLFLPVWVLYAWWPRWTPDAVTGIVALQMFLTFPPHLIRWFVREAARFNRTWNPWDGFDLRARYGVA